MKVLYRAAIALLFTGSLALRQAFPTFAIGTAGHDDLLFVRLAEYLGAGEWLGPYNNLTLAKGAAYSAFMALNQPTGIPLKLAEQALYLCASLYFAATLGSVLRQRLATLACFALLALNPRAWAPDVGGRVVREGLYTSLSLLVLALAIRVFVERRAEPLCEDLRRKWPAMIGLGLAGALYWLTREEGAWLAPSLAVVFLCWLAGTAPRRREARAPRSMALFVAIPLGSFALAVGAVDFVNYKKYGVFRNNDFRSDDFPAAYGALSRISHADWQRYVVFPGDARQKAYAVSDAASELQSFFEGPGGDFWREVACHDTGRTGCREILAGWFMWALRDAVAAAGHYSSAPEAWQFHLRLAREVNDACERGAIACGPPLASLVPRWHEDYLRPVLRACGSVFVSLISLGDVKARIAPSIGNEEELERFRRMTHGRLASPGDVAWNGIRQRTAGAIAEVQKRLTFFAVPLAMLGWIVLLAWSAAKRRWHPGHVVAAALAAAIATRVALLGFLDATSIPFNTLYLSPVVPITLAFAPFIAFLAVALRRDAGHASASAAPSTASHAQAAPASSYE